METDEYRKLIKFCAVGLCNTAVAFTVFYVMSEYIAINYILSSCIGYIAGILNSFIFNRIWTFKSRDTRRFLQFLKFLDLNIIALGINLFVVWSGVSFMGFGKVLSQIAATGFTTIFNFLLSRALVFNSRNNEESNGEIQS